MYFDCISCNRKHLSVIPNQNMCDTCFMNNTHVIHINSGQVLTYVSYKMGNIPIISPLLKIVTNPQWNPGPRTAAQINQATIGQQFVSSSNNMGTYPIRRGIQGFDHQFDFAMRQIILKLNLELFEDRDNDIHNISNIIREQVKEQIKTDPEILMCINEAVSEVMNSENIHSLVAEAIKEQIIDGIRQGLKK